MPIGSPSLAPLAAARGQRRVGCCSSAMMGLDAALAVARWCMQVSAPCLGRHVKHACHAGSMEGGWAAAVREQSSPCWSMRTRPARTNRGSERWPSRAAASVAASRRWMACCGRRGSKTCLTADPELQQSRLMPSLDPSGAHQLQRLDAKTCYGGRAAVLLLWCGLGACLVAQSPSMHDKRCTRRSSRGRSEAHAQVSEAVAPVAACRCGP
jgi:hypothetical protein